MRPKVLIAALVLALSGANSGLTPMCAAYCLSSLFVGSAAVHHHKMESQPGPASISQHMHAYHKGAECPECPPKSGNKLNQKSDCASFVQFQALKEGSFSLDAASEAAQFDAAETPADSLVLAGAGERFVPFDASHTIRNSIPASVPLRI
jgi:hypothetical protein